MTNTFEGRVTANFGRHITVETTAGKPVDCRIKGRQLRPVCGDWVTVEPLADGSGRILAIRQRRTLLVRHDARNGQQPLAANVDRMLVVVAPKPAFDAYMVDRYLAAGAILDIPAIIVFNKIDLLSQDAPADVDSILQNYAETGYPVFRTSVPTRIGLTSLADALRDHVGVVVGQSGTGKSSLLKALVPDAEIRIGEISQATDEGRHTTTVSALYHLPAGGELIDSPGVRGFQLWAMPARQLAGGFVEFQAYRGQCRFSDCSHLHEPGCRIAAAVEAGDISRRRYESYRLLCTQVPQPGAV